MLHLLDNEQNTIQTAKKLQITTPDKQTLESYSSNQIERLIKNLNYQIHLFLHQHPYLEILHRTANFKIILLQSTLKVRSLNFNRQLQNKQVSTYESPVLNQELELDPNLYSFLYTKEVCPHNFLEYQTNFQNLIQELPDPFCYIQAKYDQAFTSVIRYQQQLDVSLNSNSQPLAELSQSTPSLEEPTTLVEVPEHINSPQASKTSKVFTIPSFLKLSPLPALLRKYLILALKTKRD